MITDKWIQLRHRLHQHPETGFKEFQTSEIIADELNRLGIEVHRNIGKTGVVGLLKGRDGPRMIGLRADMDALPMNDLGKQPWASQQPGIAHACGHDGHTVMLLAAAEALAAERDFTGTVCFIFQPAEEAGRGQGDDRRRAV